MTTELVTSRSSAPTEVLRSTAAPTAIIDVMPASIARGHVMRHGNPAAVQGPTKLFVITSLVYAVIFGALAGVLYDTLASSSAVNSNTGATVSDTPTTAAQSTGQYGTVPATAVPPYAPRTATTQRHSAHSTTQGFVPNGVSSVAPSTVPKAASTSAPTPSPTSTHTAPTTVVTTPPPTTPPTTPPPTTPPPPTTGSVFPTTEPPA